MTGRDVERSEEPARRGRPVVNWMLVVLAALAAVAVVAFAYLQVLATAACTDRACRVGPGETVFGLILYGLPVVAVVALLLTFFTAKRRLGFLVWLIAWVAVAASLIVLIASF